MDDLFTILTYPVQRLAALIFSLEVADGISIGALVVSALILGIIFRALIGNRFAGLSGAGRNITSGVRRRHGDGGGGSGRDSS